MHLPLRSNGYLQKCQIHLPHRSNQFASQVKPIPDINKESEHKERIVNERKNSSVSVSASASPSPPAPTRHKFGQYKNVLLSDDELSKLKNEIPLDFEERIEKLSGYIASTGKTYKNFLATIRNWAKEDERRAMKNGGKYGGSYFKKPKRRVEEYNLGETLGD